MSNKFPISGLLPKDSTGASAFIQEFPEYDGRNTVVAILDTGVDPGARGLQKTTDGKRKIIDIIDCTGSGDVAMFEAKVEGSDIKGKTGRLLKLREEWKSEQYFVGMKSAHELFPAKVYARVHEEKLKKLKLEHSDYVARAYAAKSMEQDQEKKKEHDAMIEALGMLLDSHEKVGPIFDVVSFKFNGEWNVVVGTNEDGDLRNEKLLRDYALDGEYHTFPGIANVNFSIKVYSENLVSIVTQAGAHGTHVASICAGNSDEPELRGVAPGAQIVSLKIGDTRLGSMESGAGLSRAISEMVRLKCDVANMSYGESVHDANTGRIPEMIKEAIRKHGIVFVGSAGNAGPAISTVGAPCGTTSRIISVGAFVDSAQVEAEYALLSRPKMEYTWSSRGPTSDGDCGVTVYAPGSAITSVPVSELSCAELMNGTSMSAPNACGCICLLVSAMKQKGNVTASRISKALQETGKKVDPWANFINVPLAYKALLTGGREKDVFFNVSVDGNRGIYIRSGESKVHCFSVQISPEFDTPEPESLMNSDKLDFECRCSLIANEEWIKAPEYLHLTNMSKSFQVQVDVRDLEPGLHTGSIRAQTDSFLFLVPVTVCVPHTETKYHLDLNHVNRRFFLSNSNICDIKIKALKNADPCRVICHVQQLSPHKRHTDTEKYLHFTVTQPGEQLNQRICCQKGMIEICIAQFWSTNSKQSLEVNVEFNGLCGLQMDFQSSQVYSKFTLDVMKPQEISPKLQANFIRRFLVSDSEIKPLNTRDNLINSRKVFQLEQKYSFTLKEKQTVTVSYPSISNILYSAIYDAYLVMIFIDDECISVQDVTPKKLELKKGTYTVKTQIRHEDPSVLESLKLPLAVDFKIDEKMDCFLSLTDAIRKKKVNSIFIKNQTPLYVGLKEFKDTLPGDVVFGTFGFTDKTSKLSADVQTFTLSISLEKKDSNDKKEKSVIDKIRDASLALITLKTPDYQTLIEEIEKKYPDCLQVLLKKLELKLNVEETSKLILQKINYTCLANDFKKMNEESKKSLEERKSAASMALYALGKIYLTEESATEHRNWSSDSKKIMILDVKCFLNSKMYGKALNKVLLFLKNQHDKKANLLLRQVLTEAKFDIWVEYMNQLELKRNLPHVF